MKLWLRTDQPDAQVKLLKDGLVLSEETWHAHRELSDTLLLKINTVLQNAGAQLKDITAIFVYSGPGSFTGLRIGVTVANTLSYSLGVPVYGVDDQTWQSGEHIGVAASVYVVPEYGREANITKQKK